MILTLHNCCAQPGLTFFLGRHSAWGLWNYFNFFFLKEAELLNILFYFFNFLGCTVWRGILVPWPGIKPMPLSLEAQSLQHWISAAKSFQSCPTLCDPIDGSPSGSPVPVILQARTLEWVAISFSSAWKWKVKMKSLSRVRLLATPWTAAYQAPLSMGFSRQESWSGVPLPSLLDF